MNHSASRTRFTRGAHDPAAHAYNVVGLFSQIFKLVAYIGRTLNDTMCDHVEPDICDRCQKRLMTFGVLISGTASAVEGWAPARIAELNARLAVAAVRRLVDVVELGHPVAWAMKGGAVLTTVRRSINAATSLLNSPDLTRVNECNSAMRDCQDMDRSTTRVARKRGLVEESFIISMLLKASAKASEAAVAATESGWAARPGATLNRELKMANLAEDTAGAAVGAVLDGAARLDIDPGRAEAMMVVATGVVAEFDRRARPAGDTPNVPFGNSPSQGQDDARAASEETAAEDEVDARNRAAYAAATAAEAERAALPAWLDTPTEEYDVLNDFNESHLGDVADEAIGDAVALAADLERAESILNAIAEEHRAVEQVVRTSRDDGANAGMVTEYYAKCCVVCRDAKGRPVPSPCRTRAILDSFGES